MAMGKNFWYSWQYNHKQYSDTCKMKCMKILIVILCTYGFYQPLISQETKTRKIDELLTIYNRLNRFNGSVLVAQKGEILLVKGYGLKNVQDSTLNEANTIFQI